MSSATYRELLGNNRNFRRLWTGQIISELGTWFSFIAELGLVRMFSGSPLATMALLVARTLPFLLVAPVAGVLADRYSRKKIMIAADLLRAGIAVAYIASASFGSVWLVICCSALMSSLTMFFEAAKNAAMPNMVTTRELLTANVMMYSTRFLQFTIGSALGGLTAAQFGYDVAFVVNSLSFIASAIFIVPIPVSVMSKAARQAALLQQAIAFGTSTVSADETPTDEGESETASGRRSFLTDLREGLSYVWSTPFVRGVIMVNIGWATGGGMVNLIYDQVGGHMFAHGEGDRGDWAVAQLLTAAGAGLFVGMMLARRAGAWAAEERRAGRFIGWSLLLHGILFAISGVMPSLGLMALFAAFSRLVLGMEFGVQETLMMRVLPDEYRGRVFTTDRSLEIGMMAVSMVAGGWLLSHFSPRAVIITSGLLSASPGLIWLVALWLKRFNVPSHAVRESYGD